MKDLLKRIFVWFDNNQNYFEEVGADYERIVNEAITECGGENTIYTLLASESGQLLAFAEWMEYNSAHKTPEQCVKEYLKANNCG